MEKIILTKRTRMGAEFRAIPIEGVNVEERIAEGKTHGEARISGAGRYLLVDISNLGNHHCRVIQRDSKGNETVLERSYGRKFCTLCERYGRSVR